MGRSKSGGYAGRPMGSTKDRFWLGEAHQERRFNHAMNICKATLNRTTKCPQCRKRASKCIEAGVTTKVGARSWWKCTECGHEVTREISPKQMQEYYIEDARKDSPNPQEASA